MEKRGRRGIYILEERECSMSRSEPRPSTLRLRKISSSIVETSVKGSAGCVLCY